MPVELHERTLVGVGELAKALNEDVDAMRRLLIAFEVPLSQPTGPRGKLWLRIDDLRLYAQTLYEALVFSAAEALNRAAGGT